MKIQKTIIGTLAVIFLVSPLALLHAEDTSTSTYPKQERKEERREERGSWKDKMMFGNRLEGFREKMEERRDEMHTRFDVKRAEVITNILNRLEERFQNAIDRMENLSTRIQARIDLVKKDGGSVGEAQGFLDEANDNIDDAQKALDKIDLTDAVATTSTTTTPGTTLKMVREEFNVVKELLKDAREKLSDAINSIKKGLSTDRDDDNE